MSPAITPLTDVLMSSPRIHSQQPHTFSLEKFMLVDIYSSNKHFGKHLTVPAGTDGYKLPVGADPDFGSLKLVNAGFEIEAGAPNDALDAADVIAQIKDKGYAFHAYRRSR